MQLICFCRIRQFAFPELSSFHPVHENFSVEFFEVLFLAELILHEVWLALFEILYSLDWYNRFPNDWNQVVSEDHEQNCRENLLRILTSALQFLPLPVCNLYVLQEMTSSNFPD